MDAATFEFHRQSDYHMQKLQEKLECHENISFDLDEELQLSTPTNQGTSTSINVLIPRRKKRSIVNYFNDGREISNQPPYICKNLNVNGFDQIIDEDNSSLEANEQTIIDEIDDDDEKTIADEIECDINEMETTTPARFNTDNTFTKSESSPHEPESNPHEPESESSVHEPETLEISESEDDDKPTEAIKPVKQRTIKQIEKKQRRLRKINEKKKAKKLARRQLKIRNDELEKLELKLNVVASTSPTVEVIEPPTEKDVAEALIKPVKRKFSEIYNTDVELSIVDLSTDNEELEQQQQTKKTKINGKVEIMAGDGNCLFRSVSHQLYRDQRFHLVLRYLCYHYLNKHPDLKDFETTQNIDNGFKFGEMAGPLEVEIFSRIYECEINIFDKKSRTLIISHNVGSKKGLLNLVFSNNHYDSLDSSGRIWESIDYLNNPGTFENEILSMLSFDKFLPEMSRQLPIIKSKVKIEGRHWKNNASKGFFYGTIVDSVVANAEMLSSSGLKVIRQDSVHYYYHKVQFECKEMAWIQHELLHERAEKDETEVVCYTRSNRKVKAIERYDPYNF